MAYPDILGYKAFWHPYKGRNLPYRLLYPYNYNPDNSYPLIISGHGSGEIGDDNVQHLYTGACISGITPKSTNPNTSFSSSSDLTMNNTTTPYRTWPCFVLSPQSPNGYLYEDIVVPSELETAPYLSWHRFFYHSFRYVSTDSWYVRGIEDIVRKLINGTLVFYDDSTCLNQVTPQIVNINPNKIYAIGHSLGAILVESLLKRLRDVLAGVVHNATVAVGGAYLSDTSDKGIERYARLKKEIERYKHIPAFIVVGETERSSISADALHQAYMEVAPEQHYYVSMPGLGHTISTIDSIFNTSNKFDLTNHNLQNYSSTGVNPMNWLFDLSKPETPEDPYPLEEDTYFPQRSCLLYNTAYTGLKEETNLDLDKELYVYRLSDYELNKSPVTFTNNIYVESNYFRLKKFNNKIYRLSTRTGGVF